MPANTITLLTISLAKVSIARLLVRKNPDCKKIPEVRLWLESLEYEAAVNMANYINKCVGRCFESNIYRK